MDKEFLKELSAFSTVGGIAGAAVGFGLSFTTLPALVVGGIVGCSYLTFFTALATISKLFNIPINNHVFETKGVIILGVCTIVAAGFGVGLAAAASALFPGFMLSTLLAASTCAAIGGVATGSSAVVGKYVIKPAIEWVVARLDSPGSRIA